MSSVLWLFMLRFEEVTNLRILEDPERQEAATVLFAAKEAFYKCQYGLTHTWLGFEDVAVNIAQGTFDLSVVWEDHVIRTLQRSWKGRFRLDGGLAMAGIALEI